MLLLVIVLMKAHVVVALYFALKFGTIKISIVAL